MGSTLFIVGSPFQCLCMLEAINFFQIKDYKVLVSYCDTYSLDKIHTLLSEYSIEYEKKKLAHIVKDFIPLVFSKHQKFDAVFVGDYYNPLDEEVGRLLAKNKYYLYYLDDGTQALSIFSEKPRNRYNSFKEKLVLRFYHISMFWKKCIITNFFTIYNVTSNKVNIIHNSLSFLKQEQCKSQKGVYIIGANSAVLAFRDRTYMEYLNELLVYVRLLWPAESIAYCPHRRDTNNDGYRKWCEENGLGYYEPTVSVEYDFAKDGINPVSIVGFTSNALYTLKAIYPASDVVTVNYHLINDSHDEETQIIRQRMSTLGIKIISLFAEK